MWVATIHRIHIGLFRIAEIRAVNTEEFEEALYRRVHHPGHFNDVTVRLAETALVSEQDFATK
jgi:putative alpha-1,2-mannosidase